MEFPDLCYAQRWGPEDHVHTHVPFPEAKGILRASRSILRSKINCPTFE